ncbi:hypothetical protein Goshw_004512 [Gossypium schwendimanii]|uniref:CCHC-type domain-containing protein n=1 Tax=Gossypium schwendimanii TaxID=34291 RepID=A0A7J9NCL1_GOSSC|nr:hypothetical protein [Gossypium schwendimanii]
MVEPNEKPNLICTIWTEKSYNPDSFKAQMKSIWKTKRKFEIQSVGQNLFMIVFELEEDLETVMEGQPWLFRKSLIIFDRLINLVERDQIRLVTSPFWIKIGLCLPEFDKKYILHAIGVTFGGVVRSEINGEFCRLRIKLNIQKPFRRGIFVLRDNGIRYWIPFKYEKLPKFCFGCEKLGHDLQECTVIQSAEKDKIRENPPFSLALKAELNLVGGDKENQEMYLQSGISSGMIQEVQEDSWVKITAQETKTQNMCEVDGNKSERGRTVEDSVKPARKSSWKRAEPAEVMNYHGTESKLQKRKLTEIEYADYNIKETREGADKRRQCDG